MKHFLIFIVLSLSCILRPFAEEIRYFNLNINEFVPQTAQEATLEDITYLQDSITISYALGTVSIIADDLFEDQYNIRIDKCGISSMEGTPQLPLLNKVISLPIGKQIASITSINADSLDIPLNLAPTRYPLSDMDTLGWLKGRIKPIVTRSFNYSKPIVSVISDGAIIGLPSARLLISPVKYNSETKTIRFYRNISFTLQLEDNNIATISPFPQDDIAKVAGISYLHQSYLILAPSIYTNTLNDFCQWKTESGFNVHTILKNTWTPEIIKNTVDSVYNQDNTLKYVLLIGDHTVMPGQRIYTTYNSNGSYCTDYYYSVIAPNTERTVHIGRIPGRDSIEITNALAKIINYEIRPPLLANYYKSCLHNAYFQPQSSNSSIADRRFVRTLEDIAAIASNNNISVIRNYVAPSTCSPKYWSPYYADGKEIPLSLQRPQFSWNGNTSNIKSWLQEGGLYFCYRGHGQYNYWHNPTFRIQDIPTSISMTQKIPLGFSLTCLTGRYDVPSGSLAQLLLTTKNGGCYGIFANSEVSYSGYNDVTLLGMFAQWFQTDAIPYIYHNVPYPSSYIENANGSSLGEILENGIEQMCNLYPHQGNEQSYTEYNRNLTHIFGDPSMIVHTQKPTSFDTPKITISNREILHSSDPGASPIKIMMSISEPGVITMTDANNKATAAIGNYLEVHTPVLPVKIVVTGKNKIPYITHIYNFDADNYPKTYDLWHITNGVYDTSTGNIEISIGYGTEGDDKFSKESKLECGLLTLSDITGKQNIFVNLDSTTTDYSIPASKLAPGIYIVRLLINGVMVDNIKIIKS